jgi:hypothetical protein
VGANITETIKVECADCGCSLSYTTEFTSNENSTQLERIIKVAPCDRCIRDTFDEAYKLMRDKARMKEQEATEDECLNCDCYEVCQDSEERETFNIA